MISHAAPVESEAYQELRLEFSVVLDAGSRTAEITGTLTGPGAEGVREFTQYGLAAGVEIRLSPVEGGTRYVYAMPLAQKDFRDARKAAFGSGYFAAFGSQMFLMPKVAGINECGKARVSIEAPEGWVVATSRVDEGHEIDFGSLHDLLGTLFCAGNYQTHRFAVPHPAKPSEKTRVLVALHGDRQIDDARFFRDFEKIVATQMEFFGGTHPVGRQFLALHFTPPGVRMNIPAFNRRSPTHDTILAFHSSERTYDDFEFLGMLAHEHLHNWYPNVMPTQLGLWFMEGLNDYVAYRGLYGAKLHDQTQFSGMLSKWHREYHWCLEHPESPLMPYRRGMLAAWVFDIELRRASAGKAGLTDLLEALLHSKPASGKVAKKDFVDTLVGFATGRKPEEMVSLYETLVERNEAIDLGSYLAGTGFRLAEDGHTVRIDPKTSEEEEFLERLLKVDRVKPAPASS